jgi:DNA-binding CsgD family transcriptional regulator/PAS domain-containing protein
MLWRGLAPQVAQAFDSNSCALQVRNPAAGSIVRLSLTGNYSPALAAAYLAHYWKLDLYVEAATRAGLSKIIEAREVIPDADLMRSEFHSDWLRKLEIFYAVGASFRVGADEISFFGIHRRWRNGVYGEQHKRRVRLFVPHLQRALQLRRRLADAAIAGRAALDALDRSGTATLVVARDGRILYANARGEALLSEGDGMRAVGGRLATGDSAASERLTLAIRDSVDTAAGRVGSPGGALAIPRENRLSLSVLVAPFRPARDGFGAAAPAAILFIRDPEGPTASSLALQSLFQLTPAEAAVAAALADGRSLDEIAAAHRVSRSTARTQVRSILAKTGTRRQAELVALLLRSVATLTRD